MAGPCDRQYYSTGRAYCMCVYMMDTNMNMLKNALYLCVLTKEKLNIPVSQTVYTITSS